MVIEVCSLFLMYKSFLNKPTKLDDVKLVNVEVNESNNKGLAIMVEGSNGEYIESSSNTFPTNMIYNEELSGCMDSYGKKVENALSYNTTEKKVNLNTNQKLFCYLYFDVKLIPIREKVIEDYTNSNGVSLLSETSGDTYPVYYYTGNVTNNNIIYGDYCWKMVRTTDTGGVKLIYNGVATETDGTKSCNNSGSATSIGSSKFNSKLQSLTYVGYMYNKKYTSTNTSAVSSLTTKYSYGKSVTWDGTNYTLSDAVSTNWRAFYSTTLSNYHYFCSNKSTTCTNVLYAYYGNQSLAYYITLTGGKTVEDALNDMLYGEDVNTTDSTIKTKIDSWYESNIKEKTDSKGKLYSDYLENTIYCYNRAMSNQSTNGWNPNGGSFSTEPYFNYDSLTCENKTDQFTLKESAGGTAGYGNNALDYPIGLLTYKEASLARNGNGNNYLNNSLNYWLGSPYAYGDLITDNDYDACGWYVNGGGALKYGYVRNSNNVRPVVSLSSMVNIKGGIGDGSVTSPYEVVLP